ncbi:hypothetical protein B0I37DRAFT_441600 [Chaetomium sp. MPI-CAGE-AT-0009]|nr:hypothetical protein B0I37DRAFT_441600 [Chaetomium sp. MPI-CAGE-AT-0009]
MCFHRRLVFDCSHHAWLGITQRCEVEEAFDRGEYNVGCSVRWSHGYGTIRIQLKCPRCTMQQKGDGSRLSLVKDQIKALKEQLKAIKGDTKIKEEEWLNMDFEPKKTKSGTTEGVDTSSLEETNDTSDDEFRGMGEVIMTGNDRWKASSPFRTTNGDSWADAIRKHLSVPHNWILPVAAVALALGTRTFYQSYLRRLPGSDHITPDFFRRRSLFGKVTSVGDGDGFHLFHTPGGRLAGWGWLRHVPKDRKQLKGQTISIRIAGVDAPEGAHFGRPAQPFAAEALAFLDSYVQGRRVRAFLHRRDQYERVVATVYVRRAPFFFPRRDVGLEMLHRGLAVTYEGKTGAEFGGAETEARYREAEALAKRKGVGLWGWDSMVRAIRLPGVLGYMGIMFGMTCAGTLNTRYQGRPTAVGV